MTEDKREQERQEIEELAKVFLDLSIVETRELVVELLKHAANSLEGYCQMALAPLLSLTDKEFEIMLLHAKDVGKVVKALKLTLELADDRNEMLHQLLTPLYAVIEQAGFQHATFEPSVRTKHFFKDQDDQVYFLDIWRMRTGHSYSFSVMAKIRSKSIERTRSELLRIPESEFHRPTTWLAQSIEVDGKASWVLTTEEDIPQVYGALLEAFTIAQNFFKQFATLPQIAEYMLSNFIDPYAAKNILICAYLLGDTEMLKNTHEKVQKQYEPLVNDPDYYNDHIRKSYAVFTELYEKILIALDENNDV